MRQPTPAKPSVEKYDTKYERNGISHLFMFFDPAAYGGHRPKDRCADWAHQIQHLVDVPYAQAERITLVMDNLNTHTGGLAV